MGHEFEDIISLQRRISRVLLPRAASRPLTSGVVLRVHLLEDGQFVLEEADPDLELGTFLGDSFT
jgi:hypothetical protein